MQIYMLYLKPVFKSIRKPFKRLKVFLKQKAGWLGVPKIIPYRGFGNHSDVYLQGMVIEDKGLSKPSDRHRVWQNILATIKRFSSDGIPGVKVKVDFLGFSEQTETDEYGFFSIHLDVREIKDKILDSEWHQAYFELLDIVVENQPKTDATGEVKIIPSKQKRIIISDIDDTVVVSHSTQTLKKLRLMLFKNALSRTPFPGVATFYEALRRDKDREANHPFFYVSSSEWNLYDLLEDFFAHNDIPKGVFLLRKLERSIYKFWKSGQGNHEHKYVKIRFLMRLFKDQKFILIGDSGQRDPLIYKRLAHEFPGRVESIYIRKIGKKIFFKDTERRDSEFKAIKTFYLEAKDTNYAAIHAISKGYINADLMNEINKDN